MVRKKVASELDKAEIRLRALREKRDQINEEAEVVRQERDLLNGRRRELVDEMRKHQAARDKAGRELRGHRDKRNELHRQARELIDLKRKARGNLTRGVGTELGRLRLRVQEMDTKQQTTALSLQEENALIDELRASIRRMQELEKVKGVQDRVFHEVKEIDEAIDDVMREADEEHQHVVALGGQAQEHHDRITELVREISVLIAEANKKHEEYLAVKAKADEVHQKTVEMRSKVLADRKVARADEVEARKILKEQRKRVREELLDEGKLDAAAEEALQALLKKGKVEIRG